MQNVSAFRGRGLDQHCLKNINFFRFCFCRKQQVYTMIAMYHHHHRWIENKSKTLEIDLCKINSTNFA